MARTLTTRPDFVHSTRGDIFFTGDQHLGLTDNSDNTRVQVGSINDEVIASVLYFVADPPALLENERFKSLITRVRRRAHEGACDAGCSIRFGPTGSHQFILSLDNNDAGFIVQVGPTNNISNRTLAEINDIFFYLEDGGLAGGGRISVSEAYIDLITNLRANAPANLAFNSLTEVLSWTHSDPENDPQTRANVRIFTPAQYKVSGFDPLSSPSTLNVEFFDNTASLLLDLEPGPYRAYIRTSDFSTSFYSPFSTLDFIFPGGFKFWSGTAWLPSKAKFWNGTNWLLGRVKRWTGTEWR